MLQLASCSNDYPLAVWFNQKNCLQLILKIVLRLVRPMQLLSCGSVFEAIHFCLSCDSDEDNDSMWGEFAPNTDSRTSSPKTPAESEDNEVASILGKIGAIFTYIFNVSSRDIQA